nr:Prolyl endopeptidase [Chlamydiota bacterium]
MKKFRQKFSCIFILLLMVGYLISPAHVSSVTRYFHGVEVKDPYAWLENMESLETKQWVQQQNEETDRYFHDIDVREKIREKLVKNSCIERMGIPVQKNGVTFYTYMGLDDDKMTLCFQDSSGMKRVLVDPAKEKGKNPAFEGFEVSDDGRQVAYCLSDCGSDVMIWKFLDVKTGERLTDEIHGIKFSSPQWSQVGQGVYYIRYGEGIYYHRIGSDTDHLIYQSDAFMLDLHLILDDQYVLFSVRCADDLKNAIYAVNIEDGTLVDLMPPHKATSRFVGEFEEKLLFITDDNAPLSRLVAWDIEGNCEELISEKDSVLLDACVTKDFIVCCYLKDCVSDLVVYNHTGSWVRNFPIAGRGTVVVPHKGLGLSGDVDNNFVFSAYTDFLTPCRLLKFDFELGTSEVVFSPAHQLDENFVTEQVFVPSNDGTQIPMFLTYKKGIKRDGQNPTLMYGYGGFNLPILPSYTPLIATWLEMGGIYASVNLRGGIEYGHAWHESGMLHNKQNVFDDFISAGEWLIKQ